MKKMREMVSAVADKARVIAARDFQKRDDTLEEAASFYDKWREWTVATNNTPELKLRAAPVGAKYLAEYIKSVFDNAKLKEGSIAQRKYGNYLVALDGDKPYNTIFAYALTHAKNDAAFFTKMVMAAEPETEPAWFYFKLYKDFYTNLYDALRNIYDTNSAADKKWGAVVRASLDRYYEGREVYVKEWGIIKCGT